MPARNVADRFIRHAGRYGRASMAVAALATIPFAPAQGATTLTFDLPALQGPGTSGAGVISDPTIRPILASGVPAVFALMMPVDLQGNGRPDIVGCHAAYPPNPKAKVPCRIMRPQSDGTVADITRQLLGNGALPSVEHPRKIVVGDFNRDGRPDIFIAAHGYDAAPFDGETNILLISNADGTYTDRSSTLPQAPDFSHSACVGDIDGDGNLDIYVGNISGSGNVGPYFLMGRGDGTFTQKTSGLPEQMRTTTQEKFLTCAFVDIDGDGYPDLVLGSHGDNGYLDNVVLYNDGAGDFTRRARYVLPQGPLARDNFLMLDIVPIDINRDGRLDLLLLSSAHSTASGFGLQVLINRGDGTLADETVARLGTSTSRPGGPWCPFIRLVDWNADGWEDLYCDAMGQGDYTRLWLNNGNATWTAVAPSALPAQLDSGMINAVDFDGDGRSDLLLMNYTNPAPDIGYKSFLNRTLRTAPLDYSDMWWAGSAENGWGMSIQQHASGIQFNVLYVYDAAGKPIWYVMPGGTWSNAFKTFSGPVYVPTGTPLNNFSTSQIVVGASPGSVSITYGAAGTATLAYTLNGVSGTKPISRQAFGAPDFRYAGASLLSGAPRYAYPLMTSDIWWGGAAQSGWGINLVQHYRKVFSVWYTYGPDNKATWFVLPDASWAGNSYSGTFYATTGSAWLGAAYNAGQLAVAAMGTMTFNFSDANNASLNYNFTAGPFAGTNQSKAIVRQPY